MPGFQQADHAGKKSALPSSYKKDYVAQINACSSLLKEGSEEMLNWAWRQWLLQPGRLLLTMVVFAGVLALAMLFDGIRIGIVDANFPAP